MLTFLTSCILLILVFCLPAFGLLILGNAFPPHLTIFPIPIEPGVSSISWLVWGILAVLIVAALTPAIWRLINFSVVAKHEALHAMPFPWWGWIAIGWIAGAWILAWNRFSGFESFQPHTFPFLWFGYIATLNALTYQRSGHCLLTHRPRFLGKLFLLSAVFWWTFEYLNQYVHNWHYVNLPNVSPFEYFFFTSISFSTVLPAVLSTYEWMSTFPRLTRPFEKCYPFTQTTQKRTGWFLFALGSLGLGLIGVWPTVLFPLLWLCPLCLLLGLQIIRREETCFHGLIQGDWRPVILFALATLLCGFWWELWNVYSLVHWEYSLPYVHAFKIFEMPILGYSGYLPFGLTCLAITECLLGYQTNHQSTQASQRR